jgi:hypothetical protein
MTVGAHRREPALVTHIALDGVGTRVKLVFDHMQFTRTGDKWSLPEDLHLHKSDILDAALPLCKSLAQFEKATAVDGPDGGRVALYPTGITVARVVTFPLDKAEGQKVVATGYAVCASMDNFSKSEGRHHALANLLKAEGLVLTNKERIAECYAKRPRGRRG